MWYSVRVLTPAGRGVWVCRGYLGLGLDDGRRTLFRSAAQAAAAARWAISRGTVRAVLVSVGGSVPPP